jgi:hypothetical protein
MITYKDCPECGARKIHSTVRLCEVCETCERYESKLDALRAEVEMLRGVGCREAKAGEPESGPCGVCIKCAEERGAERWRNAHHEACVRLQEHDCGEEHARMMGYFVELQKRVEAAGELISQVGCDCPCDHDEESHDEECERCLQCLLCIILWPSVSK